MKVHAEYIHNFFTQRIMQPLLVQKINLFVLNKIVHLLARI